VKLDQNPRAVIFARTVEIPHGGYYIRYSLKMISRGVYASGDAIDALPDVPPTYRGKIQFTDFEGRQPVDGRLSVGPYRLRVVDRQPWFDAYECVLDSPLAFIAVLQRKAYYVWLDFLCRLVATARIWGAMKPHQPGDDYSISRPGFPWRDVYLIGYILAALEKWRGNKP
jgi:hypothetical protein